VSSNDHGRLLVLFAAIRAARNKAGSTARIVTPAIFAPADIDLRGGYAATELECATMKQPFALRKTSRKSQKVG